MSSNRTEVKASFFGTASQLHRMVVWHHAIRCRENALHLRSFWGVINCVLTPAVERKRSAIAMRCAKLAGIAASPTLHMCEPRLNIIYSLILPTSACVIFL